MNKIFLLAFVLTNCSNRFWIFRQKTQPSSRLRIGMSSSPLVVQPVLALYLKLPREMNVHSTHTALPLDSTSGADLQMLECHEVSLWSAGKFGPAKVMFRST